MTSQRLAPEILDPDLPIVDAHQHFYVPPMTPYGPKDYLKDVAAGHRITSTVYVETLTNAHTSGPELLRPLGEVEYANRVGEHHQDGDTRLCAGIVGYADLRFGDQVGPLLDQAMEIAPTRFRGIRQIAVDHAEDWIDQYLPQRPPQGLLQHPEAKKALAHLAPRGLSFDAAVLHHQLPDLCRLVDEFPETRFVLEHLGIAAAPYGRWNEVFDQWRGNLGQLAQRPNVTCKIGGLGMPFWGFAKQDPDVAYRHEELAELWGPYVETGIEFFGVERCMLQSNFPVDAPACDFVTLWNTYKFLLRNYSSSEKTALFSATASRVYKLDPRDE